MNIIDKWKQSDHAFLRVFGRELDRMISRPFYFGACIILPLFSIFFMSTIFGSGQMNNMPVGIVDMDQTALSREIARSAAAVPQLNVTMHYVSQVEARNDVNTKKIYGYLVIPPNFEADAIAGKGATLSYYYHYALLAVGGEIKSGFETVLRTLSVAPVMLQAAVLGINEQNTENFLVPITSSTHALFNPDLNYAIYLSNPFFFIFFQIIILLVSTYAIGSEFKFGTGRQWLETADMNIIIAICGKLLPYTIIFSILAVFANYVQFGWENIPLNCSLLLLNLTAFLFILATQGLAVFLFSLFPSLSLIISVVSMIGSLGATLSGITFPVTSMYKPVHLTSYLLPVRHFTEICQIFLYGNGGFSYTWFNYVGLVVSLLCPLLLLPRLKKAIMNETYWKNVAE